MSLNSKADSSSLGIYQKELTEYDLNRLPHKVQKGEDEHLLKHSDLIDTLNTEFSCPICLDLLKNTMVTECLHRFCSECIKKCIYKGNRECPTCRKKLISKRNLRADPNLDKLIDTIWPDRQLHEAMQREKAKKWNEHVGVVALQRSIVEGMRAQAKARGRPSNTDGDNPVEVLGQIENKVLSQPHKNNIKDGCAAKKLRLRPRHVLKKDCETNADFAFDDDSSSDSSLTSSGEDTSYEPTSDEEEDAKLPNNLIVDVDVGLFNNNKSVNDRFIGQLNKKVKIGDMPSSYAKRSYLSNQIIEDESSGISSASSSSSPFPTNENPRPFPAKTLAHRTTNYFGFGLRFWNEKHDNEVEVFRVVVPMESALREYLSKTGQLGLITVEMVPLPELRPVVESFRVKLMHGATVGELRGSFTNIYKNIALTELSFFIRINDDRMIRLHATESICTVLALARRRNFFDYPTVFFTSEASR